MSAVQICVTTNAPPANEMKRRATRKDPAFHTPAAKKPGRDMQRRR